MWEQIRSNHIRSVVLVILMGVLLVLLGASLGAYFFDSTAAGVLIALIIWGLMNLIAFAQGDSLVLAMAGAKKIEKSDHPRLYNVVEEMSIASGLPKVPDIYIIDDPALNAFATGRDINHAAVAITSGLLSKLNRDELQGVIGHEIAHIKNRDVLLMVLLSITLGAIVIISYYATRMMFWSSMTGGRRRDRRGGGGGAEAIFLILGILLAILAPIFAQLIYFALSRRREYLSDASSALYTRYPEGLASALEKLATSNTHVATANKATAPMYIADPFQKQALSSEQLGSTHPPLADRIRILRAMGGASLADYSRAYGEAHKGSQILPQATIVGAGTVEIREASQAKLDEGMKLTQSRETGDLMWRMSNYKVIDCQCGTRLRLPPGFRGQAVRCPHCGRVHAVTEAH
ncbi:MAG: M48 family metallopeptidase [Chloroflexota bacterium]